ncbi:MAG TPA: anhydro-N-acetylmuramic acid kinase [Chitinophagaceae bacterium]|jgi:anhydro-N-acetylmuramic acid kinase|nr:anhydro-N-acetylmuramic acid kinase [Chitinophagaceae bacterium]
MNSNIEKLYSIASKPERLIIGLMSGTSFDGLDVALCKIKASGAETEVELVKFETSSYQNDFKEELKTIFSRRDADLEKVCLLNEWVAIQHATIINNCLQKWGFSKNDIDLIASHGQTIYHAPKFLHGREKFPNATLQIGDGDHIAVNTGIITISDFRQKHIAAGGEGAPLAVYGDYFLFSKKGENRIMLNIGGIANFTFLPGDLDGTKIFCTDIGPGNTMMDAFVQKNFNGKYFDEGSAIAKKGKINIDLLKELKKHSFFVGDFPKTIGPELFNLSYLQNAIKKAGITSLSNEDVMATLNRFSADTTADAIKRCIEKNESYSIYVSGGGMHNSLLMENIKSQLPGMKFYTTDDLHINPDAKEAVLFALLANECVCGQKINVGKGRNKIPSVTMGKISFPS